MSVDLDHLPMKTRIWAAIRDNPGWTSEDVRKRFPDANPSSVCAALSMLELQELIYSQGAGHKSDLKRYFSKKDRYVLPKRKNAVHVTEKSDICGTVTGRYLKPIKQDADVKHHAPAPAPAPVVGDLDDLIGNLTMNQAWAVYTKLHRTFGANALLS